MSGTGERMGLAGIIINAAMAYAVLGIAAAVSFLLTGLDRVEPSARGSQAFRLLLLPGLVLLWPLVLWRWRVASASTAEG